MEPRSLLVVITRRIGDVVLATPLIRSCRAAWPGCGIDVLVFAGTEGVLAGHPDIRQVLTVPERPSPGEHLRLLGAIRRRYDLALSLLAGDRPTFYAWLAGRQRVGLAHPGWRSSWKRLLLGRWVPCDDPEIHTLRTHLRVAEALGIAPLAEVTLGWTAGDETRVARLLAAAPGPFAVLHPHPKFTYKQWRQDGWVELAGWLAARGLRVVLTGSGDPEERATVAGLTGRMPPGTLDAAGQLTLSQVSCLLARARLFVGPDTAITHMASATGTPTVTLFGPSDPIKWGPWPKGCPAARNPWIRVGSQVVGNVALVQGTGECVPCLLEGCDRHIRSLSDCLQELPARRVIEAAERLLAGA
jgi:heptosyltransferase-3